MGTLPNRGAFQAALSQMKYGCACNWLNVPLFLSPTHDRRAMETQWTPNGPNSPWAMLFCFPFLQVAVVQNMSYMSMPNGEKQYIFGKTDAGFAIADA